jgi:hypothetical protein
VLKLSLLTRLGNAAAERNENTAMSWAGRAVSLTGVHHRAAVLAAHGRCLSRHATGGQEASGVVSEAERADLLAAVVAAGRRRNGGPAELHSAGLGQLFLSWDGQPGLSQRDNPRLLSAASVVAAEASSAEAVVVTLRGPSSAREAGSPSTPAATVPPFVGDGVRLGPRAGCGKSARPVRGSGRWKRGMGWLVRHRQTKGPVNR